MIAGDLYRQGHVINKKILHRTGEGWIGQIQCDHYSVIGTRQVSSKCQFFLRLVLQESQQHYCGTFSAASPTSKATRDMLSLAYNDIAKKKSVIRPGGDIHAFH
jgi:hypothetical protein